MHEVKLDTADHFKFLESSSEFGHRRRPDTILTAVPP